MNVTQKCMSVGCQEDGVVLVRDGLLLCGHHGLKWIKHDYEAASEAA